MQYPAQKDKTTVIYIIQRLNNTTQSKKKKSFIGVQLGKNVRYKSLLHYVIVYSIIISLVTTYLYKITCYVTKTTWDTALEDQTVSTTLKHIYSTVFYTVTIFTKLISEYNIFPSP